MPLVRPYLNASSLRHQTATPPCVVDVQRQLSNRALRNNCVTHNASAMTDDANCGEKVVVGIAESRKDVYGFWIFQRAVFFVTRLTRDCIQVRFNTVQLRPKDSE